MVLILGSGHLVQAGVGLPMVQKISRQMAAPYSQQNQEHVQFALKRLDDRYKLFEEKAEESEHDYIQITPNEKTETQMEKRKPTSRGNGPSRIRTYNQAIMSRLLHH